MKQSEIKEGKMYSDGKTARVVLTTWNLWGEFDYISSVDNFMARKWCTAARFARWAKFECQVVLELE